MTTLKEQYLYGSKRLGVRRPGLEMARANRVVGNQRAAFLLTAETRRFLWPLNGCTYHDQVAVLHQLLLSVPRKTASAAEATEPFGRRCFRSSARVRKEEVGGLTFSLRFGGRASQSSWLLSSHPSSIGHPNHQSSIAHLNHKSSITYAWFKADVSTAQDYYPFGSLMPGRTYVAPMGAGYRYGFNGMPRDDEIKGPGNSLDFGARMYDSRLGRWMSVDPLASNYSALSTFVFVGNSPLYYVDPDGRKIVPAPGLNKSDMARYNSMIAQVEKNTPELLSYLNTIRYNPKIEKLVLPSDPGYSEGYDVIIEVKFADLDGTKGRDAQFGSSTSFSFTESESFHLKGTLTRNKEFSRHIGGRDNGDFFSTTVITGSDKWGDLTQIVPINEPNSALPNTLKWEYDEINGSNSHWTIALDDYIGGPNEDAKFFQHEGGHLESYLGNIWNMLYVQKKHPEKNYGGHAPEDESGKTANDRQNNSDKPKP